MIFIAVEQVILLMRVAIILVQNTTAIEVAAVAITTLHLHRQQYMEAM